ncbi:hypothetical protein [Cytobacillus firmus]|uniref:Uncharacterized protein n=1 Tax=Cytobacillus firmus DS1 TaxID=1307436 RepID=W7KRZ7_CYTFI|nr:hypothetical protein [Cytobacillus firmus]EWG08908.1 hypothetical protein PBF_22128 [Cytobacillus firmus DS1]
MIDIREHGFGAGKKATIISKLSPRFTKLFTLNSVGTGETYSASSLKIDKVNRYIYIGTNQGKAYKYDFDGNLLKTFLLYNNSTLVAVNESNGDVLFWSNGKLYAYTKSGDLKWGPVNANSGGNTVFSMEVISGVVCYADSASIYFNNATTGAYIKSMYMGYALYDMAKNGAVWLWAGSSGGKVFKLYIPSVTEQTLNSNGSVGDPNGSSTTADIRSVGILEAPTKPFGNIVYFVDGTNTMWTKKANGFDNLMSVPWPRKNSNSSKLVAGAGEMVFANGLYFQIFKNLNIVYEYQMETTNQILDFRGDPDSGLYFYITSTGELTGVKYEQKIS